MLKQMETEVKRGVEVPKPPHERVRGGMAGQSRGTGTVHVMVRTLSGDTLRSPVFR